MTKLENPYESRDYLDQYLLFHYGAPRDICPFGAIARETLEFHRRIVRECVLPIPFDGPTRALDIGCGVGRLTFELGRVASHVVGIDSSTAFVRAARCMAQSGALEVRVKESGDQFKTLRLKLARGLRRGRVEFETGDAEDPALFEREPAHLVAAVNLICRLRHPAGFLSNIERLVIPGGQLILGTPFSWFEDYTPKENWLTQAQAADLLRPSFRLVRRRDLPFVIREHRRKYELVVSQVSTFVKRERPRHP